MEREKERGGGEGREGERQGDNERKYEHPALGSVKDSTSITTRWRSLF